MQTTIFRRVFSQASLASRSARPLQSTRSFSTTRIPNQRVYTRFGELQRLGQASQGASGPGKRKVPPLVFVVLGGGGVY